MFLSEVVTLMEGEWSCYRGGLMEGAWSCYRGGQYNGGRMVMLRYPNYYKALEIYTGYFESLDIMILFSYLSSMVTTRDYCKHC